MPFCLRTQRWAPHFETELEIAQRHLDAGDQVHYIGCQSELPNCEFNRHRDEQRCQECRLRRRHGLRLIQPDMRRKKLLRILPLDLDGTALGDAAADAMPEFSGVDAMKAHWVEGFDIGYAVLSSLVSEVRDPELNPAEHRDLIRALYRSALLTYRWTEQYLAAERPDRVYVFNGRFAAMRAVLRACQLAGVDCQLHERGGQLNQFELYPNHLPHDLEGVHRMIVDYWESADPDSRVLDAERWFEERRQRVESSWHSFVKEQECGRLPANWDRQRHNVTLFCSSDDEFVAIGDSWRNEMYESQLQALRRIVRDLPQDSGLHLYLRMHPNVKDQDNATLQAIRRLGGEQVTVIAPEDPCDSYQLIDDSDTIVSFGSSVGIEAVYWQRPSVLLGPCLYGGLDANYRPKTHAEAMQLICQRGLSAGDRRAALVYGYWLQRRGMPFEYFEPESLFHGKFKGQVVHAQAAVPTPRAKSWAGRFSSWLRAGLLGQDQRRAG